jgi:ABC-type multidrug transport system fused ATPase/permease subunit
MDIAYFDHVRSGELVDRLSGDVDEIRTMCKHTISLGFRNLLSVIGGVTSLLAISKQLTGVMFLAVPLVIGTGTLYGKFLRAKSKDVRDRQAKALATAQEAINNIRTVRSFASEDAEHEKYAAQITHIHKSAATLGSLIGLFHTLAGLSVSGIVMATLWLGQRLAKEGGVVGGNGGLTSFMMHVLRLQGSLGQVSILSGEISRGNLAAERVLEVINSIPAVPVRGGRVPAKIARGHVVFEDVAFTYSARPNAPVFRGLTLDLRPNTVTALVGPSGSGKSTAANLLDRFYEPHRGRILLDGQDIATIDPSWLRGQCIGVVSQEPVLFSGTVRDNIRYARPDASDAEVRRAATIANCANFVESFPDGYETLVGERGVALSGGQKQRIAIARAVLKDPKVLILDEATSALDSASEKAVQEALNRLMKGRTTLIIAHRLSTIQDADNIAVLSEGRVVEQGSHKTLLAKKGLYFDHVNLQVEKGVLGQLKQKLGGIKQKITKEKES